METVLIANVYAEDSSLMVGPFSTPEKGMAALQKHARSPLDFVKYTIKTTGRLFWVAKEGPDEYMLQEMEIDKAYDIDV